MTDLLPNISIASALCGLLAADQLQVGQIMASRPFFAGALVGLICGVPEQGVSIGICFELLYSCTLPLGGYIPPNGLAGAASAVIAFSAGIPISMAFFYGMFFAWLYSYADSHMRRMKSSWNIPCSQQISSGKPQIGLWMARSIVAEILSMFITVAAAGVIATVIANYVKIPDSVLSGAYFAYSLVPVMGFGALYFRFKHYFREDFADQESTECPYGKKESELPEFADKKTFSSVLWRTFLIQAGWNFERYQNFGFAYTIMPFLRNIHKKEKIFLQSVNRGFSKINTNPIAGGLTVGITANLEKQLAEGKITEKRLCEIRESIAEAAASAGDSLFWARLKPVSMQLGIFVSILCGITSFIFDFSIRNEPASMWRIMAGPSIAVLAFAVPTLYMRKLCLMVGLMGKEENLFGLESVPFRILSRRLSLIGLIFSVAILIEMFVFFFMKSRQLGLGSWQIAARIVLIALIIIFSRSAERWNVSVPSAATAIFCASAILAFCGMRLPFF